MRANGKRQTLSDTISPLDLRPKGLKRNMVSEINCVRTISHRLIKMLMK